MTIAARRTLTDCNIVVIDTTEMKKELWNDADGNERLMWHKDITADEAIEAIEGFAQNNWIILK